MERKLIFQKDMNLQTSYIRKPEIKMEDAANFLPSKYLREKLPLPSVGEFEVIRHYTNLANLNFCVDTNFYPLGSCTMKYNPKINEEVSKFEGFIDIHPYQNIDTVQGALELIYNLEKLLCEITGMSRFSFQASSGAQAELVGMLMVKKYHKIRKAKKYKVIIPDSSHGTNPATAAMCGYKVIVIESTKDGLVDLDKLAAICDDEIAAMMLTNPNTLGLFEENILEISDLLHKKGALLYYDGANFNALLGVTKPSLMGFDIVHLNLHKTFSTPHGCGGPGAGAVGVREELCEFLPVPLVEKDKKGRFYLNYKVRNSIGRVRSFYGNFSVLVKAYAYLVRLGEDGLNRVSHMAVLAANYLKAKLKDYYLPASQKPCMHEVVFSCINQAKNGVSTLDIAKRLIDYGFHPPTMYFPIVVKEALMIEPTETESKTTLDDFVKAMIEIDTQAKQAPHLLKNAPLTTPLKRVDEVKAARFPVLKWQPENLE
ncbi:MAG: aminomethyl-transferring glycine dehydrogenase subunit GcvPB [Candidatus Omnitrophica bacterium]|nr:aminomethyl-transferring glycine dehydrogenase subunit GcvPB [Candidatus Omnitrophota bacterium]